MFNSKYSDIKNYKINLSTLIFLNITIYIFNLKMEEALRNPLTPGGTYVASGSMIGPNVDPFTNFGSTNFDMPNVVATDTEANAEAVTGPGTQIPAVGQPSVLSGANASSIGSGLFQTPKSGTPTKGIPGLQPASTMGKGKKQTVTFPTSGPTVKSVTSAPFAPSFFLCAQTDCCCG